MDRNYTVVIFLLLSGYAFSQTKADAVTIPKKNTDSTTVVQKYDKAPQPQATILQKEALPVDKKGAPSVFYVKNDKPVTRDQYLHHQTTSNN